jgi:hypothetical protein
MGARHRSAEFGKELRVILRPHLRFLRRDGAAGAGRLRRAPTPYRTRQRKRGRAESKLPA